MKVSDSFHVEELLHPEIVEQFGLSRCRLFLLANSMPLILTLETLKKDASGEAVTVNDWLWRGNVEGAYINSGARIMHEPISKTFSSHYGFLTGDVKFATHDVGYMQNRIMKNSERYPYIVRLENTMYTRTKNGVLGRDWLHVQTGSRLKNTPITIFRP